MSKLRFDDLKFAIRRLCKDAGTTMASVAALVCGIGAAVATWALVSAVLLKPLPIEAADRVFQVDEPPPPNVVAFWAPRYGYPVFESIRVLRDTARLVGIGLVAGLGLAVVGARFIRSLLYQVETLDPLVLVTVAAGIFGLALLVSLRPALAATRLDLTRSLREE